MLEWLKNSRVLLKSIIGTVGVKGLSLIISLFTTAAYMHYFKNQEILGVWLALVSMLNWIISFDLGIGNGLRNKLVEALSEGNQRLIKQCISSAYVLLGVVSLVILVVGNILLGYIPWNAVLNISTEILRPEIMLIVVRITFSGVILQFFLRIIISVLYALQKPAIANLVTLISHSLILLFVCVFRVENIETSMVVLAIMQAITVNLPLIVVTIWIFTHDLKKARPSMKEYLHDLAKKILNLGMQFFWIQLALLVINSTNDFLIANVYGPGYVVEYQVYDKIFILLSSGFSLITVPIWSAVTKALVEENYVWIKKTYKMLMLVAVAVSVIAFVLPLVYQWIVNIWLGDAAIEVKLINAYMFAIYNIILIFNYASTSIANGIGQLGVQMKCNTVAAILKIPLVFLVSYLLKEWIGIILVNIIIMLPCAILQPMTIMRYLRKKQAA